MAAGLADGVPASRTSPKPGDYVEYEILDQSVIVVRVDENTVKAYNNVCRHRGVKLVDDRGSNESGFICPFHGWCWGLDGANTFMYQPDLFDEANCDATDLRLTEVRVETWGGCAFINFDAHAPALLDAIAPFAAFHDAWHIEDLRAEWWHSCALPTNWKLAMEAFMEGYHTMETHPQLNPPGQKSRAAAVYRNLNEGGPPGPTHVASTARPAPSRRVDSRTFIDMNLHFMRLISEGMAGMTHMNDVRVAEGLREPRTSRRPGAGGERMAPPGQRRGDGVAPGPRRAACPTSTRSTSRASPRR